MYTFCMKQILFLILVVVSFYQLFADIAPNPIIVKGIYTVSECKIQMTSEYVFANLYNDSATVECTFNLENFGNETEIQIGFPEMNFHYWSVNKYTPTDKGKFKIFVDGLALTEDDIKVPSEMDSIYKKYMSLYFYDKEYQRKRDSIYKAYGVTVENGSAVYYPEGSYKLVKKGLRELNEWRITHPRNSFALWDEFNKQKEKGNFPWYIWNVKFKNQEKRQIKVVYSLPSGLGYRANFRYFNYILETGSGWYKTIDLAEIIMQLHDIELETLEEIIPNNYILDSTNKTVKWVFLDLEPTSDDDIFLRYYNHKERRDYEKYKRKFARRRKLSFLNPRTWFN